MLIREMLTKFYAHKAYVPATTHCGSFCFYFTMHIGYDIVSFMIILTYALVSIIIESDESRSGIYWMHVLLTLVFVLDLLFKIFGLSVMWLIISGIKPYFQRTLNIIDFCLLLLMLLNLQFSAKANIYHWWYYYVVPPFRLLAVVRMIQLPSKLIFLCPYIIKCIDDRIDASLSFDFDLATGILNSAHEISYVLPQLIHVKMIRDLYHKTIFEEKQVLIDKMAMIHMERPYIEITVKTKQAIMTSLTAMRDTLNELKQSGFVDNVEYSFIYDDIFKKQILLRSMKFIEPSSPDVIFKEVLWMGEDEAVFKFLSSRAQMIKWEAGELAMSNKRIAAGIYIVVKGNLLLKYAPRMTTKATRKKFGYIPIVDYLSTVDFDAKITDDIVAGDLIGQLSILTKRPSDCLVQAVTSSAAYFLSLEVIKEAMQMDDNPINGLESRMWKCSVIHLAIAILMEFPLYKLCGPQQIKLQLEKAFVPNLKGYKVFVVTEMMNNIILIEGVVEDNATGEVFVAPLLIPRTVQKLTFPMQLKMDEDHALVDTLQVRLLVIPIGDAEEFEIMKQEGEMGVTYPSEEKQEGLEKESTFVLETRRRSCQRGREVMSIPSDTGSYFDYQRYLEIIKLDDGVETQSLFAEFGGMHSYLKGECKLYKPSSSTSSNEEDNLDSF